MNKVNERSKGKKHTTNDLPLGIDVVMVVVLLSVCVVLSALKKNSTTKKPNKCTNNAFQFLV